MSSPAKHRVKEEKRAEARAARPPTPPPSPARSSTSTASFGFHSHNYHACGGGSSSSNTDNNLPGADESSKPEEDSGTSENGGSSEPAKDASVSPAPAPLQKSQSNLEFSMTEFLVESSREYSKLVVEEAWGRLKDSILFYRGKPVGTLAAMDTTADSMNYDQVFVRDFVPAGLAYLMKDPPEPDIVKNFLIKTLHLQGSEEKMVDNFKLGDGVLPASFKVRRDSSSAKESIVADFGGSAIGRVAPVDSGFLDTLNSWRLSTMMEGSLTNCSEAANVPQLPERKRVRTQKLRRGFRICRPQGAIFRQKLILGTICVILLLNLVAAAPSEDAAADKLRVEAAKLNAETLKINAELHSYKDLLWNKFGKTACVFIVVGLLAVVVVLRWFFRWGGLFGDVLFSKSSMGDLKHKRELQKSNLEELQYAVFGPCPLYSWAYKLLRLAALPSLISGVPSYASSLP